MAGAEPRRPKRYATLDGLRGTIAILVASFHFSEQSGAKLLHGSSLAVDCFYVLSGFVIYRAYAGRLRGGSSARSFLVRRLVRIYPWYTLGLLCGIAVQLVRPNLPAAYLGRTIAFNLALLPMPRGHGEKLYALDGPMWSLFYELGMNVVFAVALWRASGRVLVAIVVVASMSLLALALAFGSLDFGFVFTGPAITIALARVSFSFTAGMIIARAHDAAARRRSWWSLVLVAAAAAWILAPVPGDALWLYDVVATLALSPFLIWLASRIEPPFVLRRPLELAGDISFPLYTIHDPFIRIWIALFRWCGIPAAWGTVLFAATMCVAAAGVAHFYDGQARAYLSSRLRLRESAPAQIL